MANLAIIGGGNMAEALIKGALASKFLKAKEILVAEPSANRRNTLSVLYKIGTTTSNAEAACWAPNVLLSVKPQQFEAVGKSLKGIDIADRLWVSIMAGVTCKKIESALGLKKAKIARVMPNTPALVLEGASALYFTQSMTATQSKWTTQLFSAVGRAVQVEKEEMMDTVTGLSGSGPAYIYMVIEAMSDGGVAMGLPRALATELAAQTVLGAARMVMETQRHTGVLKDQVTSPGGTTITGLRELEASGVRSAFIEAVSAATEKSRALGK